MLFCGNTEGAKSKSHFPFWESGFFVGNRHEFFQPKRIIQKMLEMLVRYQTEGKLRRKEPMQQLAELFGPVMMLMLFETVYIGESHFDTKAHIKGFLKSNRP